MNYLPNLENISTFVLVARMGSFTKAAGLLGLSTNAASRRVMELERELGARLMVRTTRSISLTEEGQTLFSLSERSIDELLRARHAIRSRSESIKGRVRIALPSILATPALLNGLRVAQTRYGDLTVQILISDGILEQLRERVEISIEPGPLSNTDRIARRIGSLEWKLAASRLYVERHGIPKTPKQLEEHYCLPFVGKKRQKNWRLKGENGKGISVEIRSLFESNDSRVLKEALAAGLGIGPVSLGELDQGTRLGVLTPILPDFQFAEANELYAVYLKDSDKIPRIRVMLDLLTHVLGGDMSSQMKGRVPLAVSNRT